MGEAVMGDWGSLVYHVFLFAAVIVAVIVFQKLIGG